MEKESCHKKLPETLLTFDKVCSGQSFWPKLEGNQILDLPGIQLSSARK